MGTGQWVFSQDGGGSSPLTTKGDIYTRDSSADQRLPVGTDGFVLSADSSTSTGIKWVSNPASNDYSGQLTNHSVNATVAANALTIALKDKGGSDASAGSPILVAQRNATVTVGRYNQRSVTGALSLVVSSGSTLGHTSGIACYAFIYLIDNSGTQELAISSSLFDEGSIVSTTAEGGAGAADSQFVMYSTTARSNVPCRLIGRILSNQATAGTWASAMSEISLPPVENFVTGSFTATFDIGAWNSSHAITIKYVRTGNLVTLSIPQSIFAGTNPAANSIATSAGDIPAGIRPLTTNLFTTITYDNAAISNTPGRLDVSSSGTLSFQKDASGTNYTVTANCGWVGTLNVTYLII